MRRGVRRLKRRKVAGLCVVEPKVLKAGEVVVQWLTEFFNMMWRVGVIGRMQSLSLYIRGQQNRTHKLQRNKCVMNQRTLIVRGCMM